MVQRQTKEQDKDEMVVRVLNPNAAGIDVGSRSHWAAVGPERASEPVREFGSFTGDLHKLADWLKSCGVTTVAMESTAMYWIPIYDLLAQRGFEVMLVSGKQLRGMPARKSDVKDCQWLQHLHTAGLLVPSFRPGQDITELRSYSRLRERIVREVGRSTQHMQKALNEMNLQIHHVVSDLTGATGLGIVRAMVAGERDGNELLKHRDPRCKQPKEKLLAALQGTYKPDLMFALETALANYDHHQERLAKCDEKMALKLAEMEKKALASRVPDDPPVAVPEPKPRSTKANQPKFEIHSPLFRICGDIDLSQLLAPGTALALIAEVGTDMSKWESEKHFASWLNLAPGTRISGGKSLSSRRGPARNRAGLILRQAAVGVGKTQTALGAFYRRMAARGLGSTAAIATARKMAVIFYRAMRFGIAPADAGLDAYERQFRDRQLQQLQKKAAGLGYQIVPVTPEVAAAPN